MWEARSVHTALSAATSAALSPPKGPVSLEIPVDVQREMVPVQTNQPAPRIVRVEPDANAIGLLAERIKRARCPMLWLGGGARDATKPATT